MDRGSGRHRRRSSRSAPPAAGAGRRPSRRGARQSRAARGGWSRPIFLSLGLAERPFVSLSKRFAENAVEVIDEGSAGLRIERFEGLPAAGFLLQWHEAQSAVLGGHAKLD